MSEEKIKKYESIKTVAPVIIDITDKQQLSVELRAVKRESDGKIFKSVYLVTGYKGGYGFNPNKKYSVIQLPNGITAETMQQVTKAVVEALKYEVA